MNDVSGKTWLNCGVSLAKIKASPWKSKQLITKVHRWSNIKLDDNRWFGQIKINNFSFKFLNDSNHADMLICFLVEEFHREFFHLQK